MDQLLTALERAFQIARSGECQTIGLLKNKLRDEGYDQWQVSGHSLTVQLNNIMYAASGVRPAPRTRTSSSHP
jgi:hypothetical protein